MIQNLTSVGKKTYYYISGACKAFKDSSWYLVKLEEA